MIGRSCSPFISPPVTRLPSSNHPLKNISDHFQSGLKLPDLHHSLVPSPGLPISMTLDTPGANPPPSPSSLRGNRSCFHFPKDCASPEGIWCELYKVFMMLSCYILIGRSVCLTPFPKGDICCLSAPSRPSFPSPVHYFSRFLCEATAFSCASFPSRSSFAASFRCARPSQDSISPSRARLMIRTMSSSGLSESWRDLPGKKTSRPGTH